MTLMEEKILFNEKKISSITMSLAKQISSKLKEKTVLIGVDLKGKFLAERLKKHCESLSNYSIELGTVDTSLYRNLTGQNYINLGETNIPFCLKNKHIILVFDSLKSGKSIYAALNALSDFNEPASIDIACLFYLNLLHYPFLVKYVGKTLNPKKISQVTLQLLEVEGNDLAIEKIDKQSPCLV